MLLSARAAAVAVITFAAFTDILAYSIAVPVLPDISRRFGASATMIGMLFASFGLTVLVTSVPAGAMSDRFGRKLLLVGGMLALAASTVFFAVAPTLSWLFAARLVQGAADAVTWVVGFAVVADLYQADERGRVMGLVTSGTTLGFLLGPTIGGWLYESGGPRVPYLVVGVLALVAAGGCAALRLPPRAADRDVAPIGRVFRVRAVAVCAAAVIAGGGTIAMVEPVLALHLADRIGLGPARIGWVFGAAAIVSTLLHPVFGRIADRTGGRVLTLAGLAAIALALPIYTVISSFESALVVNGLVIAAVAMFVSPSLAYMAEATSQTGQSSFGVAYGVYNFAWALGILIGPALGGLLYERIGFAMLTVSWAIAILAVAIGLVVADRNRSFEILKSLNP